MLMPSLGPQQFSFTVTQLLQNEPDIKLSTNLPSPITHSAHLTGVCYNFDIILMLHSLENTVPVDILQYEHHKKQTNKNTKKTKQDTQEPKAPKGTFLLLLKHTANNLDIFKISLFM